MAWKLSQLKIRHMINQRAGLSLSSPVALAAEKLGIKQHEYKTWRDLAVKIGITDARIKIENKQKKYDKISTWHINQ